MKTIHHTIVSNRAGSDLIFFYSSTNKGFHYILKSIQRCVYGLAWNKSWQSSLCLIIMKCHWQRFSSYQCNNISNNRLCDNYIILIFRILVRFFTWLKPFIFYYKAKVSFDVTSEAITSFSIKIYNSASISKFFISINVYENVKI